MNAKLKQKARVMLDDLTAAAETLNGPSASEIHLAFTDADDYPEFDNDPGANYVTGWLVGAAEALEIDILSFIMEVQS